MPLHHATATIASGQSLSGIINVWDDLVIVGLHMPDAWDAADITILGAETETGDYSTIYDAQGTELTIDAAADRFIAIAPDATRAFRFVKLRSGTAALAVNQTADRAIGVVVAEKS